MNMQMELVAKMEKLQGRLERLSKKMHTMGLDKVERDKYLELFTEYIKMKFMLNDDVFNTYIVPKIMYGEALEKFKYIQKKINWDFDYIFDEDKMNSIYNRYIEEPERELVKERLVELYHILLGNLIDFYKNLKEQDFYKDVSLLFSNEGTDDFEVIIDHYKCKFERIYMILKIEEEIE